MNKFVRRALKISGGILGVTVIGAGIFAALNWTLLRNLPNSQAGGIDAMFIANQSPLQLIKGSNASSRNASIETDMSFAAARKYWEGTGGKALLVWHKGELIVENYSDGVLPSDRSRSFSLHKSVLGLVAATMEADELISLDDPISLYVDAYKKGGRETLTIRDMLQHNSGLERYSFSPPSLDTLNLLLSDKVEKAALKAKIVTNDGVFDYSNLGYQVAGAAIRRALEQKTSQTYAQYVSSRIWEPSGARDAYLWSETPEGAPRFYAGLQAAPRDWLQIGIMIARNNGDVIPRSAIETVLKPSNVNPAYGLGVWLGSPEDGAREYGPSTAMTVPSAAPFTLPDTVFFDGFGGQRVYISQKEQLVVVRIGDVRFDWDDSMLPNLVVEALGLGSGLSDTDIVFSGKHDRDVNVRFLSHDLSCRDCKLAILSHGAFAGDEDYNAVAIPLANMGYHVAIPTHVDSKSHPDHQNYNPQDFTAFRIEDHELILQYFAKTYGEDTSWVSVGHSFGAMIAAYFAGATTDASALGNLPLGLPSHTVALSPPGMIPGAFSKESFANLSSPTLLVTGTTDIVPTMIENWEEHLALFEGAPAGKVRAVVFDSQDHYFNGLYGRPLVRKQTQADVDLIGLMTEFLGGGPLPEGDGYRILR